MVESLDRGGLERVVVDLALTQMRSGALVDVACLFHAGALGAELTAAGISVHRLGKRRGPDLRVLWRLRSLVRASGATVVHTHNPVANYYTCAALAFWRGSPPVVNTRHNMGAADPRDRREALFSRSVARTAIVAMVSATVRDHFVAAGIVPTTKAMVVPNGIPVSRYRTSDNSARARARAALGLVGDTLVVGAVGRLAPVKDHRTLLRATAILAPRFPRLLVVLVGAGPLRDELAQLVETLGIARHVRFAGERDDVPAILPAFDAFAQVSLSEGHSIALLEAAAAGLGIVATRTGGNPEIVEHGRTGLLVEVGDAPALAAALSSVLGDAAMREALGDAARAWATATVSVEAMAAGYRRVYDAARRVS